MAQWAPKIKMTRAMEQQLISLGHMHTPHAKTHWEKIFEPLKLAATFFGEDICEIALTMEHNFVKSWKPEDTGNWQLPRFRIDGAGQLRVGAVVNAVGEMYTKVRDNYFKSSGTLLAEWNVVKDAWSACATWFYHYWVIHPHLSKKQAYLNALQLGSETVQCKADTTKLMKQYRDERQAQYWWRKTDILLTGGVTKVVEQDVEEYYIFKNEDRGQEILKNFLETRPRFKLGTRKDMVALSKRWWNTCASQHDKTHFGLFQFLKSAMEIQTLNKRRQQKNKQQASRKRTRETEETRKLAKSREDVPVVRQQFWANASNNDRADQFRLAFIVAIQAKWRKWKATGKKPRQKHHDRYSPLQVLNVTWNSTGAKGRYVWVHPKTTGLELQRELFSDLEIPTLEGVNNELDRGNLTEKVKRARSVLSNFSKAGPTARMGRYLIELRSVIQKAVAANDAYSKLAEKAIKKPCCVCKNLVDDANRCVHCHERLHLSCGFTTDKEGEMECSKCVALNGTAPPLLLDNNDGSPWFEKPGKNWAAEACETYVMIMNFVNKMHLKGVITPAFHELSSSGRTGPIPLSWEACRVLVAASMHDLETMGTSLSHFRTALQSWLPPLFSNLGLYLKGMYEICTLTEVKPPGGTTLSHKKIDTIYDDVAGTEKKQQKKFLIHLRGEIQALHKKGGELDEMLAGRKKQL